jgi:hypothetical protein
LALCLNSSVESPGQTEVKSVTCTTPSCYIATESLHPQQLQRPPGMVMVSCKNPAATAAWEFLSVWLWTFCLWKTSLGHSGTPTGFPFSYRRPLAISL